MPEPSVDVLWQACGAAGPLALSVEGPDHPDGREVVVGSPCAVLGSQPRADVHLPGEAVGKRHAYLQVIAGRVFCVELDDEAPVRREDGKHGSGWLDPGQALLIGPYRVRLLRGGLCAPSVGAPHHAPDDLNPLAAGSAGCLGAPAATLQIVRRRALQARWPLDRLLALVGRNPVCKVRIHQTSVSRVHCALIRTPHGTWLIDLLSESGVRVNGERVRLARLADADRIQIRDVLIRAHFVPPPLAVLPDGGSRIEDRGSRIETNGLFDPRSSILDPRSSAGDPALAALLFPLVGQFNQMQQQMFDQFRQALIQMFQMFSALHNDQVGFIREELDRLHALTQELHAVQLELARANRGGEVAWPPAGVSGDAACAEPPTLLRPAAGPSVPLGLVPGDFAASPDRAAMPEPCGDVHAWLCQRMESLQQERQGRWQNILAFLTGKRGGDNRANGAGS